MAIPRILCWALVFLLRLPFPPGESIADILKKWFYGHRNHKKQGILFQKHNVSDMDLSNHYPISGRRTFSHMTDFASVRSFDDC